MRFRIWDNGGNSEGPHNWRYDRQFQDALVPQDKAMNDRHLDLLKNEWLQAHNPPRTALADPIKLAAWKKQAEIKAMDWARKNEPRRFLNPLLRSMNGIPADTDMRRNQNGDTAILSSSWVGDASTDVTGKRLFINLGGKKYTYGVAPGGFKNFLGGASIGRTIAQLRNSPAGTTINGLTKLAWGGKK